MGAIECTKCGACCIAPDISSLNKPAGVRCQHLTDENLCAIYDKRPEVCRVYQVDETCLQIQAATLEERVTRYQILFEIAPENSR